MPSFTAFLDPDLPASSLPWPLIEHQVMMIMIWVHGEPDDDEYADDSDQRGMFLVQHLVYELNI